MNILVTGGTGFLGRYLVRRLLADGYTIAVVGRNFSPIQAEIDAGVQAIHADLRNTMAIRNACARMDLVYHVGALTTAWGKTADFYAINVGGTQAVLQGCAEHKVKRLIYVSSPSVIFTGQDICAATEETPYPRRFTSLYAQTKKLGEDLVNAASSKLVLQW